MRMYAPIQALGVALFLAVAVGCSDDSPIAPHEPIPQGHGRTPIVSTRLALDPIAMRGVNLIARHHFASFYSCPATGAIEYISDFINSVVNVYSGKLAGQGPCGQLSPPGMHGPEGIFVRGSTHDLYVANSGLQQPGGHNILVFHRGETSPFKTYTDPTRQWPVDVTVAKDGTVIASNILAQDNHIHGSISTWHNNGIFVGNFPMINDKQGMFVTVQKDGTLYYSDLDETFRGGLLWTGRCPHGACGPFTSTGATTGFPGGLRSVDDEDVVEINQGDSGGTLITYESFPTGVSCAIPGASDPVGFDIKRKQHHVIYADSGNNVGGEIDYPSCAAVGTVPGNRDGIPIGAAVDEPDPL